MTSRNIDDAQSSVADSDRAVDEHPDIIRPTVRDYIAHTRERIRVDSAAGFTGKGYAVDTAHKEPATLELRFLA
jgi:hypothetical protein